MKEIDANLLREILDNNDLICFSETWREQKDDFQLNLCDDFLEVHHAGFRNFRGGRASGGMSLLIRKSVLDICSVISTDSYHVWCKLHKEACGWASDLYICFLYIPPSTSNLLKSGQSLTFDSLQNECALYENLGWVLLLGDTNSRTGDLNDYIENDEIDDFLPTDDNYQPDLALDKRISDDAGTVNTNGTSLIEFCKSTGYRILNGRVDKKLSNSFTYFSKNGNSVVDYALLKNENFRLVANLKVGNLCELSDHCPIEITIKSSHSCNVMANKPIEITATGQQKTFECSKMNLVDDYSKQFIASANTIEELKSYIENENVKEFLDTIKDQLENDDPPIDTVIECLRSKLIEIAANNFQARNIFRKIKSKTKKCPWFDSECKSMKTSLNKSRKSYQTVLKSSGLFLDCRLEVERNNYFSRRREYKTLLKRKQKHFLENEKQKLWNLKTESPKTFWKKLNRGQQKVGVGFTKNQLYDYFSTLLNNNTEASTANSTDNPSSLDNSMLKDIDNSLNKPITITEVEQMVKRLKSGKASGLDMLSAELLKNLNDNFFRTFVALFKKIFKNGEFPEEWAIGIIVVIFKGGEKENLDNYRGITLLSIFGKLFTGILLHRLNNVVSDYEIIGQNQIAYRKGYQTSDHIFTLRAIIENTFANKGTLYLCFVDFKKAFDSINHKELLDKLVSFGINGDYLRIISSLYSKVKSCVRGADGLTDLFSCSRGVRQGCLLSPLLFALYLNDLDNCIRESSTGVAVGNERIHTLLYADDLVLMAKDPVDLQSQLDALAKFAGSIEMEMNMDKTKIMILRNKKRKSRAKSCNQPKWFLGKKQIKECESYKYLGVTIKSNGSFSEHVDKVREKAQKSYFSLLAKSREWGGFQPRLFLYLFDHTIMPIISYASDIWGAHEWPKLERLHLSACKYALGVKSSTNTDAVYSELGRIAVQSHHHINILKFYNRLLMLDNQRYAKKTFEMLVCDANSGHSNWVTSAKSLQVLYNVDVSDSKHSIKAKVRQHFHSKLIQILQEQISQDKKLKTYALFKTTINFEKYLDIIPDYKTRSCYSKLRVSAHNLQIEVGRYKKNKTPRDKRYCIFCQSSGIHIVEDEKHFVMECPLFSEKRKTMLNTIYDKFPSTKSLNNNDMFIWLMSQEDSKSIQTFANYLRQAFTARENNN